MIMPKVIKAGRRRPRTPLSVGKNVYLSPSTLIEIELDNIVVSSDLLTPGTVRKSQSHYMETYDLEEYVDAITNYLAS